jgi:hypothetical protein
MGLFPPMFPRPPSPGRQRQPPALVALRKPAPVQPHKGAADMEVEQGVAAPTPKIPLPGNVPPTGPVFPRLVNRLESEKLIDPPVAAMAMSMFHAGQTLLASELVMKSWLAGHRRGLRPASARTVYSPNSVLFPELRVTTFEPGNLECLLQDELHEVADFLFDGFANGFRLHRSHDWEGIDFKNGTVPDPAALKALEDGIASDLAEGFLAHRPADMAKVQSSPVFIIPKKSMGVHTGAWRRIHHLSKRQVGSDRTGKKNFPAVNDDVDDDMATMSYTTSEDLQERIVQLRRLGYRDIRMGKIDLKNAYKTVPMAPSDWCSLGFTAPDGRQYLETRLCFGLKLGCRLFSAVSGTVAWALNHILGVFCLSYIDDFAFVETSAEDNERAVSIASMLFEILGLPVAPKKTERAQSKMVFLGILHDATSLTVALPEERRLILEEQLRGWLDKPTATILELQTLCGCLCYATRVLPAGRPFLRRIFAALKWALAHKRDTGRAIPAGLGEPFKADIRWWLRFLPHLNNTRPMIGSCDRTGLDLAAGQVFTQWTDASDFGCAGVLEDHVWQLKWDGDLTHMSAAANCTIATREMYAIAVSCMVWGHRYSGGHAVFMCDNKSDVDSFARMGNDNPHTMHLIRLINYLAALHGFTFSVVWIKSADNPVADLASRVDMDVFLQDPSCSHFTPVRPQSLPPKPDNLRWEEEISTVILQQPPVNSGCRAHM